ncbi:hypothetical protein B0H13DRAFT_1963763 [Mycena leptocephala]|nr:hypothetical protein B0H13DRAFT_1963763 [Mycena leptocephala]
MYAVRADLCKWASERPPLRLAAFLRPPSAASLSKSGSFSFLISSSCLLRPQASLHLSTRRSSALRPQGSHSDERHDEVGLETPQSEWTQNTAPVPRGPSTPSVMVSVSERGRERTCRPDSTSEEKEKRRQASLRQQEHGQEQEKLKCTRINLGSCDMQPLLPQLAEVKTPTRTRRSSRVRTVVLRGVADGDLGPASVSEGDQKRRRDTERG